ncbi:MAG TPA: DUF2812 domain-containing protein [Candidatus Onthomonas avicola]|nr:DUF2812 domain-containing protein [Candidatus Onthomonas avicola]
MEQKTMFRYYTLADFREEEEFLAAQHQAGWRLVCLPFAGVYRFERCEPAEYIYQLDFNGGGRDEGAYLQMFADYGWEYVQKFNGWYYFRKAKGTGELGEEIFSDSTSRLAMIRRVYRRLALCFGMLAILPIIWLWQIRGTEAAAVVGCWYLVLVLAGLLWLLSIFHKLRGLERAADYPLPDGK